MFAVFASDASVAVMADWVELEHVLSRRESTTDSRVVRADRVTSDDRDHGEERDMDSGELDEIEILDSRIEVRRQQLWDELSGRSAALGASYPFVLFATPTGWGIRNRRGGPRNARIGRLCYKLTLLMASFKHDHIVARNQNDRTQTDLEKQVSGIFQLLAVLAACNLFGSRTQVYWFGFPRPDHTGFHTALPMLLSQVGHGEIRPSPPYGTESDQDATIDLVAWRSFGDRRYGSLMVFGQVASGDEWDAKSIHSHIKDRFFEHFIDPPATRYLGATFMPFVMHTRTRVPADGNLEGARNVNARRLEKNHGILVDRLRLTDLISDGIGGPDRLHNVPDLPDAARQAFAWMRAVIQYCPV